MPNVNLTADEIEWLAAALNVHSNYIQTGNVALSAADVIARNDRAMRPKALDTEQMRKVVALADLRDKLLKAT